MHNATCGLDPDIRDDGTVSYRMMSSPNWALTIKHEAFIALSQIVLVLGVAYFCSGGWGEERSMFFLH